MDHECPAWGRRVSGGHGARMPRGARGPPRRRWSPPQRTRTNIRANPPAEAQALSQRPAVKDATLRRQGAELGVKMKKAEYIPDVSLEVRYTSPIGAKFVPKNLASVGVFASWDVWDWGKRSHEVAAKNLELEQARNNLREVQARVRADVNRKIRALRQAEARIPVAQLAERTAREKLRVAENRYREGAVLIEDVLEAESDLANSRRDTEEAKLGVWKGWADLQRAMGEE